MAISRAVFLSFVIELATRNPTMGIPALEDGLFPNLLMFDHLYYIFVEERTREGKREVTKGREKEREKGREGKKGRVLRRLRGYSHAK